MYAEAYNEFNGPGQPAYDALNKIRARGGLKPIETVWSDATIVRTPGKHQSKEGLRDIIHRERTIELSFEGKRYFDVLRWKKEVYISLHRQKDGILQVWIPNNFMF